MLRSFRGVLASVFAVILGLAATEATAVEIKDPENTLIIELSSGKVVIEMLPDVAPEHVKRIKELARAGEYDNVAFHRVIEGFMAQTGDVRFGDMEEGFQANRAGTGGSDKPDLRQEFSNVPFERGTVGMARSQNPNSANSQFFIMFEEGSFLNGQYTVWGQVIEGMEFVDNIKRGAGQSGAVTDPDRMMKVTVAADG
ncbi:MAG: peptidylprolyl isomerase [Pseudomonadota bacterium]